MQPDSQQTSLLDILLKELQEAIHAKDHDLAYRLEKVILKHLVIEAAYHAQVEQEVNGLMQELPSTTHILLRPDTVDVEANKELIDFKIDESLIVKNLHAINRLNVNFHINKLNIVGVPPEGVVYPVWFGTNRKPAAHSSEIFTNERNNSIKYGRVDVYIPQAHRFGETDSSFWTRLKRFEWRDDQLRLQSIETHEQSTFFSQVKEVIDTAKQSGETSQALLFLHGFNVSFEEAAIRAAQIGFDLRVPGATAFFSWPSRGTVRAYTVDEASIEASEKAITQFLVDFTKNCGAEKVHIIAHSMGNRGFLRSLQRIAANSTVSGIKFGQIILAAPDIDRDLFLDLADLYPRYSERTTLYTSDSDLPVHLSSKLHDAPRAGYFIPYTIVDHIDTVAVPDFDIDLLGHSYFAQAEALLYDMHELMHHNSPPQKRQRIVSDNFEGSTFWRVKL